MMKRCVSPFQQRLPEGRRFKPLRQHLAERGRIGKPYSGRMMSSVRATAAGAERLAALRLLAIPTVGGVQ
jgi:hypothetical protein